MTLDINRATRSAMRLASVLREVQRKLTEIGDCNTDITEDYSSKVSFNATDYSQSESSHYSLLDAAKQELRNIRIWPNFGNPSLFGFSPALRFLIELFVAEETGGTMPVSNACLIVGGSTSAAMRTIASIEGCGLVGSCPDPADGRRRLLHLLPHTRADLERYLGNRQVCDGRSSFRMKVKLETSSIA